MLSSSAMSFSLNWVEIKRLEFQCIEIMNVKDKYLLGIFEGGQDPTKGENQNSFMGTIFPLMFLIEAQ